MNARTRIGGQAARMTGRISAVVLTVWLLVLGLPVAVSLAADPAAVCLAGEVALADLSCAKCPEGMATVVKAERDGLTCVARGDGRGEPGVGLGWRVGLPAASVSVGEWTVRRG